MSRCSDAPEDEAISLFEGLLPNPDMTLTLGKTGHEPVFDLFLVFLKKTTSQPEFDTEERQILWGGLVKCLCGFTVQESLQTQ